MNSKFTFFSSVIIFLGTESKEKILCPGKITEIFITPLVIIMGAKDWKKFKWPNYRKIMVAYLHEILNSHER